MYTAVRINLTVHVHVHVYMYVHILHVGVFFHKCTGLSRRSRYINTGNPRYLRLGKDCLNT